MTVAADLNWWRGRRGSPDLDRAEADAVLARLLAWKADHDRDRQAQPGPFLKMAWDGVFGDEDGRVADAIAEIEAALGRT